MITVVWKIFVWNYFVVENVRENNFHSFPVPTKIFNNKMDSYSTIIILSIIILSFFSRTVANKSGRKY